MFLQLSGQGALYAYTAAIFQASSFSFCESTPSSTPGERKQDKTQRECHRDRLHLPHILHYRPDPEEFAGQEDLAAHLPVRDGGLHDHVRDQGHLSSELDSII